LFNEVKIGDEPGMQADQWGAAARATSGVRSNETLDSGRCQSNIRRSFPPIPATRQPPKNPEIIRVKHSNRSATTRCPHQRFQLCGTAYRTSLFSTFTRFYTAGINGVYLKVALRIQLAASVFLVQERCPNLT
jgi:hypothetical protein